MSKIIRGIYIPLTRGYFAIIDPEDFELVGFHNWQSLVEPHATYATRPKPYVNGKYAGALRMHRVIMGVDDPNILVDHIDGNGLNNRRKNLRIVSNAENTFNRKRRIGGTSKYKGVVRRDDRWVAAIYPDGKNIHLGTFMTEEAAAQAYNEAAKKYHGQFAHLNHIEL